MSIVHVLAVIKTKLGQRASVLEIFNANVPAVLAEDGCIAYEATIDTPNAGANQAEFGLDTFVVVEKWASLDALKTHSEAAHMKAYGTKTAGMLADRTIHILSTT